MPCKHGYHMFAFIETKFLQSRNRLNHGTKIPSFFLTAKYLLHRFLLKKSWVSVSEDNGGAGLVTNCCIVL